MSVFPPPMTLDPFPPLAASFQPNSARTKVISLSGYAGAGKDTVAQILVDNYGFERIAFADALRKALYALNPLIPVHDGERYYPLQSVVDIMGWDAAKRTYPEVRRLQQVFGTEVGRMILGPDVWVNIATEQIEDGGRYVFTDTRFQNEFDRLHDAGGIMVRVNRPGVRPVNSHVSDNLIDTFDYTVVLDNDGDLVELEEDVREMMEQLSISQQPSL